MLCLALESTEQYGFSSSHDYQLVIHVMCLNYRPISLLTSFSKVFQTIIYTRTITHLHRYNILSTDQYGFGKRLRTDNAIYKLTSEILNSNIQSEVLFVI
jgi:hypothetical protein